MNTLGLALAVAAVFVSLSWMNVQNEHDRVKLEIAKLYCAAVKP